MSEARYAAEILARLNPKVVDASQPGGGGGKATTDVLQSCDIAAALAGIPRGPYLLARVKYALDDSCRHELIMILRTRIARKAKAKGWTTTHPEWFQGMAELAVLELMPAICPRCKGRNDRQVLVLVPKRGWINCPSCNGTGQYSLRQAARARAVGIPWESWRRTWRARQDWVKTVIIAWEAQAIMSMIRQLRRSDDG